MITLRDVVEIGVRPDDVFDFLVHLDEHYTSWHADHRSAEWVSGRPGSVGSVLAVEERLHGTLHRLRLRVTKSRPNREIEYRINPSVSGAFRIAPIVDGCSLSAELMLGWDVPIAGPLVDAVLARLFRHRLDELRVHMQEEGARLKEILETRRSQHS